MKIKINQVTYEVRLANVHSEELNLGKRYGTCNYTQAIISISRELNNEQLLKTTIHELTHAHIYEYASHEFSDNNEMQWKDEDLCYFMQNYALTIVDVARQVVEELRK